MVEFVDATPGMNPEKLNNLYKQATIEFDNDEKALFLELAAMTVTSNSVSRNNRKERPKWSATWFTGLVRYATGSRDLAPIDSRLLRACWTKWNKERSHCT